MYYTPHTPQESFSREYPKLEGVRAVEREVVEAWRWYRDSAKKKDYMANRKGYISEVHFRKHICGSAFQYSKVCKRPV